MFGNILKVVFVIGFIAGFFVRTICVIRVPRWWRSKQKVADDRVMWREKLLMIPLFFGMQVIPLVYVFSSWLDFVDYHLPLWANWVTGITGGVVFALALWLLWRSHVDLGQNFSPELKLRKEHTLVTDGIFRLIRHPMYTAHLLWAIAQVLLLHNWIAGFSFLVTFYPFYLLRVPREERMMLENFGQEYSLYMNRTGRLLPRYRP